MLLATGAGATQLLYKALNGGHRPSGATGRQLNGRRKATFAHAIPPGGLGNRDQFEDLRQAKEAGLRQSREVVLERGRVSSLGIGKGGASSARLVGFHDHLVVLRKWPQDRKPKGGMPWGTLNTEGFSEILSYCFLTAFLRPFLFDFFGTSYSRSVAIFS